MTALIGSLLISVWCGVISVSGPLTLETMSLIGKVILEAAISAWEMQQPPVLLPSKPMSCRSSIQPTSYLPLQMSQMFCGIWDSSRLHGSHWKDQAAATAPDFRNKMSGGKSTHSSHQAESQRTWRTVEQTQSLCAGLVSLLMWL